VACFVVITMRIHFRGDPVYKCIKTWTARNVLTTPDVLIANIKQKFTPEHEFVFVGNTFLDMAYLTYLGNDAMYVRVGRTWCEVEFEFYGIISVELDPKNIEFTDTHVPQSQDKMGLAPGIFSKYNARRMVLTMEPVLPADLLRLAFEYLPHF